MIFAEPNACRAMGEWPAGGYAERGEGKRSVKCALCALCAP